MCLRSKRASSKVERAKQYLNSGGVTREDSDDELGLEDHPWQWIYAENKSSGRSEVQKIMGARMGHFQCMIGDCVLLKAEGNNEAWIGLICNFVEEDEEEDMAANFMWFSTEKEIRNKQKKATDVLPVDPLRHFHTRDHTERGAERSIHHTILGHQSSGIH